MYSPRPFILAPISGQAHKHSVTHTQNDRERERGGKLVTYAELATKSILRQSSRPCKQTFIQKKNLTCLRQDLNTGEAILTLLTRRKREEGTGCVRKRERATSSTNIVV